MKASYLFFLVAGIALVLTTLVGAFLLRQPYQYQGSVIDPAIPAADITLVDQFGKPFQLSQNFTPEGGYKAALIFFGYVHCPDVCPVTLSEYRQVKSELKDLSDQLAYIFITVDPERDTPEILRKHLANFDPAFIGLSGNRQELEQVWKDFNIIVVQHPPTEAGGYLVDHTARVFVVDHNGDLRMTYPFGSGAQVIAEDMRHLLAEK